jgi:hypothetical protein
VLNALSFWKQIQGTEEHAHQPVIGSRRLSTSRWKCI